MKAFVCVHCAYCIIKRTAKPLTMTKERISYVGKAEADLPILISRYVSELLAEASDLHREASQLLEAVCCMPSSEFINERNEEFERLTKSRLHGEVVSQYRSQNLREDELLGLRILGYMRWAIAAPLISVPNDYQTSYSHNTSFCRNTWHRVNMSLALK